MNYTRKLAVAVVTGAFIATSTVGASFAAENQKSLPTDVANIQEQENSTHVDQSNEKPQVQTLQAEPDETKTIKLDENKVNMLGVSWNGEDPDTQIRYKTNNTWSKWETLPKDDEGGPDLNSNEAKQAENKTAEQDHATDVVPVLNSSEVQFKSLNKDSSTKDLEVTKVTTDVTEKDKEVSQSSSSDSTNSANTSVNNTASIKNLTTGAYSATPAVAATNTVATNAYSANSDMSSGTQVQNATYNNDLKANIVTRKEWGANEKLKRCASSSTSTAKGVFIHHTAGSNSYTKSQAPGIIRGYLSYHTQSKGWCDLGYNFLVDKYGTIYEGRAGSVTKAMTGAHASGFNSYTIGISVLGTYTGSAPSSAAQNSVKRVIAWKANQYGFNPTGKMTLTSGGGGTSKYAAGKKVSLNVVSGHRDTSYTACPGNAFYKKLSSIRSGAKSMQSSLKGGSSVKTKGAIGTFYKKNKSMTGAPKANERTLKNPNGAYQQFKNGKVYWSSKTGAHFVKYGAFNNAYKSFKYEKGSLGYATSEIKKFKYRSGATYQNFEKGMITYSKETGAQVMTTTMLTKWKSLNWERSKAKLPTKSMKCGLKDGGCYQQFEGGKLHWSKKSGVHFTKDKAAIQKAWIKAKGTSGKLGYPTTEEFKSGSKVRQNFTGGYITWDKRSGAKIYYSKK